MAKKPKFNINDLVAGGGLPPVGPEAVGGPPIGAPMGAGALPPEGALPPLPPARPPRKKARRKGKGGGY